MLHSFRSKAFAALAFTALFGAGEQVPVTPPVPLAGGGGGRGKRRLLAGREEARRSKLRQQEEDLLLTLH